MAEHLSRLWTGLILLALFGANPAQAHDLGVARVALSSESEASLRLEAILPMSVEALAPNVPEGCRAEDLGKRPAGRLSRVATWRIHCVDSESLADGVIRLDWQREGAMIAVHRQNNVTTSRYVRAEGGVIQLTSADWGGENGGALITAGRYLLLGIEHILLGFDHLAFVLALCLVARGWRLVKLITAFTLGHSLTLALATLGWIAVPVPPLEVTIALSIAFVAREALVPEAERRHGFGLVLAFGMLHGIGFASVLSELGIDSANLLLALFAFNLGVEVGQILFVGLVLCAALPLRKASVAMRARLRFASAFSIGALAMFWTIERMQPFLPTAA